MRALFPALLVSSALTACTTFRPPQIEYDAQVPSAAPTPALAEADPGPQPLHRPPPLIPARGGKPGEAEASAALDRIEKANDVARVEPRRDGYFNAVQVFSYSPGALYQVYASPGQVTDIGLEPGERLIGSGPIAAGDTVRWIIGDTESGAADAAQVHVLVKPTRPDIDTNLIINTDRRTYHLELRSREEAYMPAVSWFYPEDSRRARRPAAPAIPAMPDPAHIRFRYAIQGDSPPWRPLRAVDDGRKVFIEFPRGIGQGEMPPLLVLGPEGEAELVNYRVYGNLIIVDRLFAAAELRLGSGKRQQRIRIVRTDGMPSR